MRDSLCDNRGVPKFAMLYTVGDIYALVSSVQYAARGRQLIIVFLTVLVLKESGLTFVPSFPL